MASPSPLRPMPVDLFSEVPVTLDDIEAWDATPRRRTWYAKCWDVVGKVRRAKLAGQWPPEIENRLNIGGLS